MARYTLIVGTKNWSSWSLRPWLALRAIGQPFEEIVIRLNQPDTRESILKHSPSGKVPALKIEENSAATLVFDSLAICETLAERHPEARLWPSDPEARAYARSISAVMHSSFPDLRAALSMDFARTVPTPPLSDAVKAQIAEIAGYWETALERFGNDGFLFGAFSIADCMYAPAVSRFKTYGIEVSDVVKDYMARVFATDAMTAWMNDSQTEVEAGLADRH